MEEEKIYNDLLNYFEGNYVTTIETDLDLPYSMVRRIKSQVKVARAGESKAMLPAQMAKLISFYIKQVR